MTDSPELAAIRARDAGIGNDAAFHRTISQVYLDRRTLLRMLDEAHRLNGDLVASNLELRVRAQALEPTASEPKAKQCK